jgi:hypothetical protein
MLQTLGVLKGVESLFFAVLFAAAGAAFLYWFSTDREKWWALIPGFVLLGLAAVISIEGLFRGDTGGLSGGVFLGSIGLGFLAVYLVKRDFWWALIPAGVMVTLGVVAATSNVAHGNLSGGLFFLGLAATFGMLYFVPTVQGPQKWAAIPAIILAALGVLSLLESVANLSYILPAALIVVGAYLLWRAFAQGKKA